MMRLCAITGLIALLSACGASVESERPLFGAGQDRLKPGIWAVVPIDKPCELPKDTNIFTWPDCAAPILMNDSTATYFSPEHVMVRFELADGTPRIIQADKDIIGGWIDRSDKPAPPNPDRRFYASFYPSSEAPFTAGRLQFLLCPSPKVEPAEPIGATARRNQKKVQIEQDKPIAGLRQVEIGDDTHCIADTPEAVRELARRGSPTDASFRIAWIGSPK